MTKKILLAGLVCALGLTTAGAVSAQPYDPACVRSNENNTATGAVVGGIAGALLGSAVAGRHERGEGAVIGGVGGAVVGGAVASSGNHPCPEGYYYRAPPPPPRPMAGPPPGDFWYGAPVDIHQRFDFLQHRIDVGVQNGFISPRDGRRFAMQLNNIRRQDGRMRYRDGGELSPMHRDNIQGQLNALSNRLHWEEHRDAWDHDGDHHDWDRH